MTVLCHQTIKALCDESPPLLTDTEGERFRSASYDLRCGDEYYLSSATARKRSSGRVRTSAFDDRCRVIEIPPHQLAFLQMHEGVNMPKHLVGHLSLKLQLLLEGVIMANQSQVDAGYRGNIFVLLYNLRDRPVRIERRQPIMRLEFAELDEETELPYEKGFSGKTLADVISGNMTSSLQQLNRRVDQSEKRIRRRSIAAVIGGLIALFVGYVTTMYGAIGPFAHDASHADSRSAATVDAVKDLREHIKVRDADIAALRREVADLRKTATPTTVRR